MTTHRVLNVHERNEAIQAAIDSIGRSQTRRKIFEAVYTGKRAAKLPAEISKAINISLRQVLTQGKKLSDDGAFEQKTIKTPEGMRVAYFKLRVYSTHKQKVLAGIRNPRKSQAKYPTKQRPKIASQILQRIAVPRRAVPEQVYVTEIDSFARSRTIKKTPSY